MKKIISLILSLALVPLLFSCGKSSSGALSGEFKLKAILKEIGEYLTVEIIESDYAFGVYWVLTPDETKFYGIDEAPIARSELKLGSTLEIAYGGQVMMSYPPKIVAASVRVIE